MIVPVLVIGLVTPAAAQKTEQDARKAVERECDAWIKAAQRKDVNAIAALYTENAMYIRPQGVTGGRPQIKKAFAEGLKPFSNLTATCDPRPVQVKAGTSVREGGILEVKPGYIQFDPASAFGNEEVALP